LDTGAEKKSGWSAKALLRAGERGGLHPKCTDCHSDWQALALSDPG